MQKLAAAQIHEGFLQVFQVFVRHMVLVPCLAVNGPFHGILGAATLPDAEERRIRQLKEAGFNAIRSSHHPAGRE